MGIGGTAMGCCLAQLPGQANAFDHETLYAG